MPQRQHWYPRPSAPPHLGQALDEARQHPANRRADACDIDPLVCGRWGAAPKPWQTKDPPLTETAAPTTATAV
jgi:hypothetical protein